MQEFHIEGLCEESMEACRLRIDNLTKPIYSLAHLERMAERMAGIYCKKRPNNIKKAMVIFCGQNRLTGHSLSEEDVIIAKKIENMKAQRSATDAVAKKLEAPVHLIVCHERRTEKEEGSKLEGASEEAGSSLSFEQIEEGIQRGIDLAKKLKKEGVEAVGLGHIGIKKELMAEVLTLPYIGEMEGNHLKTASEWSSEKKMSWNRAIDAIDEDKRVGSYLLLQHFATPDVIAMVGFILGAAASRMAVVVDDGVTASAALVAEKLAEGVKNYIFASIHIDEPIHHIQMELLGLKSFLHYRITADGGIGSALGLSLLDASLYMLNDMKTFGEAAVTVAEDGPGSGRQDQSIKD